MKITSHKANSQKSSGKVSKGVFFGCGGCLAVIIIGAIAAFFIVGGVMKLIKESEPYKMAMAEAAKSPVVIEACGEPIEAAFMSGGSLKTENGVGSAELVIPISGPKGAGVLTVSAHHEVNQPWHFDKLDFTDAAGKATSLAAPHEHEEEAAPAAPPANQ